MPSPLSNPSHLEPISADSFLLDFASPFCDSAVPLLKPYTFPSNLNTLPILYL
jgi:hypothetical protein